MKKFFSILAMCSLLFAAPAFACVDPPCIDNENPIVIGTGWISGSTVSSSFSFPDFESTNILKGHADGFSVAGGIGTSKAFGGVENGTVSAKLSSVGGGLFNSETSSKLAFIPGGVRADVISQSQTYAVTGADLSLSVDPGANGFGGGALGTISGFASQSTLDKSNINLPWFYSTNGSTTGSAGQGSFGGFYGNANVSSGSDYQNQTGNLWMKTKGKHAGEVFEKPFDWHPGKPSEWEYVGPVYETIDSNASATVGAKIEMTGLSYSDSFRYMTNDGNVHTEGLGTFVGASTTITSSKYNTEVTNGNADASSCVTGGYLVGGGVRTTTIQNGQSGHGFAMANGSYFGVGSLGTSFTGSANGYSQTQITTVGGMNGSIVNSSSEMTVTSTGTGSTAGQSQAE